MAQRLCDSPEYQTHTHTTAKQKAKPGKITVFRSGIITAQTDFPESAKGHIYDKYQKHDHRQQIQPPEICGQKIKRRIGDNRKTIIKHN